MSRRLILASSSPYRRELLTRLGQPFETARPDVDETPQAGETVAALVRRLALAKAQALAPQFPDALIIGSDQAAELDDRPIGKPGDHERAFAQLQAASGREIRFHTAVVVLDSQTGRHGLHVDLTTVRFRTLDDRSIGRYLEREQPYDCAGSFKCEGLGIALFDAIESRDPTALVGLPLIALCQLLRERGLDLP